MVIDEFQVFSLAKSSFCDFFAERSKNLCLHQVYKLQHLADGVLAELRRAW